jgi:multidrug efflux pump subunit AcrA (membrane-fusion protein)
MLPSCLTDWRQALPATFCYTCTIALDTVDEIGFAPMFPSRQLVVRVGVVCGLSVLAAGAALYLTNTKLDIATLRERVAAGTSPPPPPAVTPVPVSIAFSRSEPVKIYPTGIGTVQAYNTVAVKSRVDGEITQVLFQEGQDVKAGDPLAIIDPRPLQAQLAAAACRACQGRGAAARRIARSEALRGPDPPRLRIAPAG